MSLHKGLSVSPGIGVAPVFRLETLAFTSTGERGAPAQMPAEEERLHEACAALRIALRATGSDPVYEALLPMLEESLFRGSILDRVRGGSTAEDAVVETVYDLKVIFGEIPDPLFRLRGEHAEEVGRYLFRQLKGQPLPLFAREKPVIIATEEMSAFDAVHLRPDRVAGIVCARGGQTSHFAIVAKQAGIPVVSGLDAVMELVEQGMLCICDGTAGTMTLAPDKAEQQAAWVRQASAREERDALLQFKDARTATRDGIPVALWGNIAGPSDVQPILDAGGCGVGMFRTEFIFTGDEAPSEERQTYIYADILRRTPGPVVMRTLEAGGDKTIPYLAGDAEENPNLGWQGLRMCLETPELFSAQLRAMIRASCEGDLWIMFPFVSARWELLECRRLVAEADADVRRAGGRPGPYKVGIMVEIPSAAIMAREYLQDFDFCSIGTNDLTQFTLAADRMNPNVARWYDPFHPAVLRLIAMTAAAANEAGKPIGMAGDMAGNPRAVPLWIGLGFSSLSATAPRIAHVKKTILSVDRAQARRLAARVLQMPDTPSVMACLREQPAT